MIRLLLGSKIGAATMYPWRMQAKMALNALTRGLFVTLLATQPGGGCVRVELDLDRAADPRLLC